MTHDAHRTDDHWRPRRQFFKPESGLAPAHQYLLPSAFPVGFKFRTNPSQNHRISLTVMTSSPLREGDIKWHIWGYTASVSCMKSPSCGFQYSRLLLYSRQLEILSGGKNLRRGKLAFRRISQPTPPFTNYHHTETCLGGKVLLRYTVVPKTLLGRPQPQWICHRARCQACLSIHSSIHHFCIPHSLNIELLCVELLCVRYCASAWDIKNTKAVSVLKELTN